MLYKWSTFQQYFLKFSAIYMYNMVLYKMYCISSFLLEIPVFPTVTAKVTFTSFDWRDDIDDAMFVVPPNYRENPNRFPDLWQMMDISIMDIVSSVRNVIIVQEDPENPGEGYLELAVGMEVPLTNLGICSTEMTLLF